MGRIKVYGVYVAMFVITVAMYKGSSWLGGVLREQDQMMGRLHADLK